MNREISWQSLHAGAMFKSKTEEMVQAKQLILVKDCSTKSKDFEISEEIDTENGTVTPHDGNHHILCAMSNPAGESFCFWSLSSGSDVTFAISCKNVF